MNQAADGVETKDGPKAMNGRQGIRQALGEICRWIELIEIWRRRSYDRRMLMLMSDSELKDLGVSRYEAYREARKPFWRA